MSYQLTSINAILRLEDNVWIPKDESNGDYLAYLRWLEEGNTPLPDPDVQPYTWEQALAKRDKALHDSDWTMIPGCTVDQHAWAVYRQILRDIPQTFKDRDPLEIVWPEKPSTLGPNTRKEEEATPVETPANVTEEHAAAAESSVAVEETPAVTAEEATNIFTEPSAEPVKPDNVKIDSTEVK